MKKFYLLALLLCSSLISFSQSNIKKDAQGNYSVVKTERKKADTLALSTGKTFTDVKGNVWPIFKTSTGRIYALRTSRNGTQYKQYLDKKGN